MRTEEKYTDTTQYTNKVPLYIAVIYQSIGRNIFKIHVSRKMVFSTVRVISVLRLHKSHF